MKLLFITALFVAHTYAQSCEDLFLLGETDQEKIDFCKSGTTSEECGCTWASWFPEGCVPDTCAPTEAPNTTPAPTDPTTTILTTQCVCPTQVVTTLDPTTTVYSKGKKAKKAKSKDKNSGGNGIGDCDCDKDYGVTELRFRYQGTEQDVNIEIFYEEKKQNVLCEFTNVQPGDEIICNIDNLGHDFQNETPFVVTYQSGETCEAQYHTSCSSDIVDLVQDECTDLICTGWRDGNPITNDCDDGVEPCDCDDPTATPAPTSENPTTTLTFVQTVVGDNCYCDATGGAFSTTSSTTTTSYKKKKKKKSSSDDAGKGYGDCDCDKTYGMAEMRLLYSGDEEVDIVYVDKQGQTMCTDEGIEKGEESVCNIMNNAAFEKFSTNTYVKMYVAGTTNQICMTTIHTSCSSDIVGTYGDEKCGYDLQVSGWKDGNPNDDNDCDDGVEECPCDGVFVDEPEDPLEEEVVTYGDQCFCSNVNETSHITSVDQLTALTTTQASSKKKKNKRSNKNGWGFGYCDCDGGIQKLRFVYKGTEAATITLESKNYEAMCSFDNVVYGDENECEVPSSMSKFSTDTYVTVETASGSCTDSIHTSCSQDIIGWTAGDCTSFVVSGWQDNNSAGECDDGFEPCDCESTDCTFDDEDNCVNQDGTTEGCTFDEGSWTCTATVGYFSNGVELIGGVVAVVMAAVSVLAM